MEYGFGSISFNKIPIYPRFCLLTGLRGTIEFRAGVWRPKDIDQLGVRVVGRLLGLIEHLYLVGTLFHRPLINQPFMRQPSSM